MTFVPSTRPASNGHGWHGGGRPRSLRSLLLGSAEHGRHWCTRRRGDTGDEVAEQAAAMAWVAVPGGVLVDQRRPGRGMAHPGHQFLGARSRCGRQGVALPVWRRSCGRRPSRSTRLDARHRDFDSPLGCGAAFAGLVAAPPQVQQRSVLDRSCSPRSAPVCCARSSQADVDLCYRPGSGAGRSPGGATELGAGPARDRPARFRAAAACAGQPAVPVLDQPMVRDEDPTLLARARTAAGVEYRAVPVHMVAGRLSAWAMPDRRPR